MGKIRNQGSASLEATLVMSVFLLAMVSLFWMAQSVLAEAQVYEAAAETAEYMAEIAYLGAADTAVAYLRFPKYADEKETVERYVKHGVSGVQFLGSEIGEEYIVLRGKLRDGTSGHTIVYNPKTGIYRGCEGRYRDGCGTCGGCICICDGQSGSVSHDTQMQLSNLADSGKYVGTGKT